VTSWPPSGGSGPYASGGVPTLAGTDDGVATLGPTSGGGELETSAGQLRSDGHEAAPAAGEHIGAFIVQRVLGTGAMGVVVLARDPELDRPVAIKLLAPHYGNGEVARQRLVREAQAVARLSHPNVIAVHQVGTHGDRVYMVMEYVDGGTLRQWLHAQPRSVAEILGVYRQAAHGLAAAHAAGLVHRDFKPDNVLIGLDGRVRVSDFGLVTPSGDSSGPSGPPIGGSDVRLTQTGAVLGTPAYMAPEQFAGLPVDARADQFAMCVALFEALYGVRPFSGDNVGQLYAAIAGGRMVSPTRTDVPASVHGAVVRGLDVEPDARHPSMQALAAALVAVAPAPVRAGPPVALAVGGLVAVLAVAGGLGLWLWRGADPPVSPVVSPPVAEAGSDDGGVNEGADTGAALAGCPDEDAPLPGIWDPARRESLRRAFAETGYALAGEAATRTIQAADDYTAAIAALRRQACAKSHPTDDPQVAQLGAACLQDAATALGGVTDGLIDSPSIERVNVAADLLDALPVVGDCADAETLAVRPAEPTDAQLPQVQRARRLMWTVAVMMQAQEVKVATETLETAKQAALPAAYLPVAAELQSMEGTLRLVKQDMRGAETLLREAIQTAVRAEHPAAEADAAIGLLRTVGHDPARLDEALQIVAQARDALARARAPHVAWALETSVAALYEASGRVSDAEASYSRALQTLTEMDPPKDSDRAYVLTRRAASLRALGRLTEAEKDYEAALSLYAKVLGDAHPLRVGALVGYATLLMQMGRFPDASAQVDEAQRLLEAAGTDLGFGVEVMWLRASVAEQLGTPADVVAALEDAVRRYERTPSLRIPRAHLMMRLGAALLRTGQAEEADEALAKAVTALDVVKAPMDAAAILRMRGEAAFAMGELEIAERRLAAALQLTERGVGVLHPAMAAAHVALGEMQMLRGNCVRASESFSDALEVRAKTGVAADADLAKIYLGEANCAVEDGRLAAGKRALADADRAITDHALAADVQARADLVRAKVQWAEGDAEAAHKSAIAAREGFSGLGPSYAPSAKIVQDWLDAHAG
jgi:tetratricopeptide (TPR) repeat protein